LIDFRELEIFVLRCGSENGMRLFGISVNSSAANNSFDKNMGF
tara:strand:+ start:230 stop:358 length:129 start_codon:yes stop_codon:yes gene_type:complete